MEGLRVELTISSEGACPVADATATADAPAREITWSENGEQTVEQFSLGTTDSELPDRVTPIFEYEEEGIYEFHREEKTCPCERIEADGHPVADVRAEDGQLHVTLHIRRRETLGDIVRSLKETYEEVAIRSIARAGTERRGDIDLVPINRGKLTGRQKEVLETAYAMGYFDYPRGANASEVADELDICASTLTEHIAAAQTKLLTDLLGERSSAEN